MHVGFRNSIGTIALNNAIKNGNERLNKLKEQQKQLNAQILFNFGKDYAHLEYEKNKLIHEHDLLQKRLKNLGAPDSADPQTEIGETKKNILVISGKIDSISNQLKQIKDHNNANFGFDKLKEEKVSHSKSSLNIETDSHGVQALSNAKQTLNQRKMKKEEYGVCLSYKHIFDLSRNIQYQKNERAELIAGNIILKNRVKEFAAAYDAKFQADKEQTHQQVEIVIGKIETLFNELNGFLDQEQEKVQFHFNIVNDWENRIDHLIAFGNKFPKTSFVELYTTSGAYQAAEVASQKIAEWYSCFHKPPSSNSSSELFTATQINEARPQINEVSPQSPLKQHSDAEGTKDPIKELAQKWEKKSNGIENENQKLKTCHAIFLKILDGMEKAYKSKRNLFIKNIKKYFIDAFIEKGEALIKELEANNKILADVKDKAVISDANKKYLQFDQKSKPKLDQLLSDKNNKLVHNFNKSDCFKCQSVGYIKQNEQIKSQINTILSLLHQLSKDYILPTEET